MKYLPLLLIAFCIDAWSCSCIETKLEEYYEECDQIFVALLFDVKEVERAGPVTTEIGFLTGYKETIKGEPGIVKELKNEKFGTSCDVSLFPGKYYLICGKSEPQIELMACSKTSVLYYEDSWEMVYKIKSLKDGIHSSE